MINTPFAAILACGTGILPVTLFTFGSSGPRRPRLKRARTADCQDHRAPPFVRTRINGPQRKSSLPMSSTSILSRVIPMLTTSIAADGYAFLKSQQRLAQAIFRRKHSFNPEPTATAFAGLSGKRHLPSRKQPHRRRWLRVKRSVIFPRQQPEEWLEVASKKSIYAHAAPMGGFRSRRNSFAGLHLQRRDYCSIPGADAKIQAVALAQGIKSVGAAIGCRPNFHISSY